MHNLRFSMTSLIYGILIIGCGGLLYFGAEWPGGIVDLMVGSAAMVIGLIRPGKFVDTGNSDFAMMIVLFPLLSMNQKPAWILGISGFICLVAVVRAVWTRQRMQRQLAKMWQLADQYGYEVAQIQQLALATNKLADYPKADWLLTRANRPHFYPNAKAVQGIVDAMQVGRMV